MYKCLQGQLDLLGEIISSGFIPKRKRASKYSPTRFNMLEAGCAFDIETTTLIFPSVSGEVNAHGFMYIWQFQINEKTIIGRTWEDFTQFISDLSDSIIQAQMYFKLQETPLLIVWVHNLSFEFQWLSALYNFENEDVFFRDVRKPIYARINNIIEFRCSYIQTNMNLHQLTVQLGVEEKLSGDEFDYSKVRYPWTDLTPYELEYCVRDVRSLVECMRIKMRNDGDNLHTIPLTSTGYVRRDCIKALSDFRMRIKGMLPDEEQYRLLRMAFRGGNTHANAQYSGHIVTDVYSYDMSSCYPAQQLTKLFPMRKFRWLDRELTLERLATFLNLGYAVVGLYKFKELRLKNKREPIPYLSRDRLKGYGFILDNGRILEADYVEVALTEIDLKIVLKQYDYFKVDIIKAMVAQKEPLPEVYKDVIRTYFDRKTKLKPPKGEEAPYIYHKSKEKLNGIYGMSAQDPVHQEILFNHGQYTISDYESINVAEVLGRAHFPYQWGVYTTALARAALQEGIDKAGKQMLYCDTDSIKTKGPVNLNSINNQRIKTAEDNGALSEDRYGEKHYVGVFELEGKYDRFITCGAKRYAYEQNGHMSVTVSGVCKHKNPDTNISYAVEELGELENFHEGFVWHKAAGSTTIYNDNDDFYYTDPETGKQVHIIKNIAIVPRQYEMKYGADYKILLNEIELYGEYQKRKE